MIQIRPETKADQRVIHALTRKAFAAMNFSDGTEADAIDAMRNAGDMLLSLVAEDLETKKVIGHCAFSRVRISAAQGDWIGLGPICVRGDLQRQGIGRQLIETGLKHVNIQGAAGCVLIGNPDIYTRLGFIADGHLQYGDLPTKNILYRVLNGVAPRGELIFAPALQETDE